MFFPNMVLGIRVLHSRRKVDQDGYIYIYVIRMDQEVYISAWRVAWIRELGRISWSDPFPSMADARATSTGPPRRTTMRAAAPRQALGRLQTSLALLLD